MCLCVIEKTEHELVGGRNWKAAEIEDCGGFVSVSTNFSLERKFRGKVGRSGGGRGGFQ